MLQLSRFWASTLVLSFVWALLSQPAQNNLALLSHAPSDGPANVLLLTAHPDDECMFFAPTLLALQAGEKPANLHSLCLSVGNADGLGEVRRHELEQSLDVLGIADGRRWVIDRPDLQDNFTADWDTQTIAEVVKPYVLEHEISVILTFDHQGISSHPNHISLPKGAARLLSTLPSTPDKPRPRLFSLITVPLHEKYLGPISPIFSKLAISLMQRWQSPPSPADAPAPSTAITVSDWAGYARALKAMMQHRSQLVWFRWLYVSFSRYMWVNEWVQVVPPSEVQTASGAVA
ncbi:LmbE-like protein [Pilatotrama ljubarskyi]|nr:LmbE-like protein [Pilatotrama ljubarskyi]